MSIPTFIACMAAALIIAKVAERSWDRITAPKEDSSPGEYVPKYPCSWCSQEVSEWNHKHLGAICCGCVVRLSEEAK